jgi:hypothetical protein
MCGMICLVAGLALAAEHRFDGDYTRKRSLVKGSGPSCPAEEDVFVTIHGQTLTFTNSVFKKFAIGFYPRQDGSFGEIYVDEGGNAVKIRGRVIGDAVDADVSNPPCENHWHLKKEHRGQYLRRPGVGPLCESV